MKKKESMGGGRMWMYNQCRVSASLLADEDLRTQPEIICHKTKSMEKGFPVQNRGRFKKKYFYFIELIYVI